MLHGVSADTPRDFHADSESDGERDLGHSAGGRSDAEASCTSSRAGHESRRSEGTDDPYLPGLRRSPSLDFGEWGHELFGTDDPRAIERDLFGSEDEPGLAVLGELDELDLFGHEDALADGLSHGQVSGDHLQAMPVGVGAGGASASGLVLHAHVKEEDTGLWPFVGWWVGWAGGS